MSIYKKSINAKIDDIYYHPTLEVENKKSKNGLNISVIGKPNNYEFQITYKRPQIVKLFFGLNNKIKDIYSVIEGQTKNDVIDCLKALLSNDAAYLERNVVQ